MSTEDRKALPVPPDLFDALLKAIRETVRAEMRAEFEARRAASEASEADEWSAGHHRRFLSLCRQGPISGDRDRPDASYQVATSMNGQPI